MENFCKEIWENPKINSSNEQNECIEKKYIPESLKQAWWWPIIILDWCGPLWWAQMWAYLYHYLETNKPLPKAIIWSSIWSMIALYLQNKTKEIIKPNNDKFSLEYQEYEQSLRVKMMQSLRELFENDFERIWTAKKVLDTLSSKDKKQSNSQKFFTTPLLWAANDIFEDRKNNNFDVWVAISIDVDDKDKILYSDENKSYITYNQNIDWDYIDASTAYKWTLWKEIDWINFRDWNYWDYIKTLSEDIWEWQKIIFLSSYNLDRPYNFSSLNWKVAILEKVPTNPKLNVDDTNRFNMTDWDDFFQKTLKFYREIDNYPED